MKVFVPTTIHGSRQTGMTARSRGPAGAARQIRSASASQGGSGQPRAMVNIRRSEEIASSRVRMTVTQTVRNRVT